MGNFSSLACSLVLTVVPLSGCAIAPAADGPPQRPAAQDIISQPKPRAVRGTLDLQPLGQKQSFEACLSEWREALAASEAPLLVELAAALRSAEGQLVVARAVDDLPDPLRQTALERALAAELAERFRSEDDRYVLRQEAGGWAGDLTRGSRLAVDQFASHVQQVRRGLVDRPLTGRLRDALNEPSAGELIYATMLTPPEGVAVLPTDLAQFLEPAPNGEIRVNPQQREAARALLAKIGPVVAAINRTAPEVAALAERVEPQDALARQLKQAMQEPLFVALLGIKMAEAGRPAEAIQREMLAELKSNFSDAGKNLRLRPNIDRGQLQTLLNTYAQIRAVAEIYRKPVRGVAQQIAPRDELHRAYRQVVGSETAVLATAAPKLEAGGSLGAALFNQTLVGSVLLERGGQWVVNPFRRGLAVRAADDLERWLRDARLLSESINAFAANVADAQLREQLASGVGRYRLARRVSDRVNSDRCLRLDVCMQAHLQESGETYRVAQGSGGALRTMLQEIASLRERLAARSASSVTIVQADYERQHLSLLESSAFYNANTAKAANIYQHEFADHHAARLWGLFGWNSHESTSLQSFLNSLDDRKAWLQEMAASHDKLMIILNFTPSWLSRSNDARSVEGHWQARNAVRPRDWEAWKKMVQATVRMMKSLGGAEIYYEVWNEPDLAYWQEGVPEYLELYERTVQAVKEVDPQAKVGGSAVNRWDGKPQASRKREALNLELIRFAAEKDLPLDFVSWHYFAGRLTDFQTAKDTFARAARQHGLNPQNLEFLITEWNVGPLNGTPEAAGGYAEIMYRMIQAGVDMQFFSAWEEFNQGPPDPAGPGPWGMITKQGVLKPEFHVHRLFDRLSRDSEGIAVQGSGEAGIRAVASKKTDGSYELLVWEMGRSPAFEAAVQALLKGGVPEAQLDSYETVGALERSIRTASPMAGAHRGAFEKAQAVYRREGGGRDLLHLTFPNAAPLRVVDMEAVVNDAIDQPRVVVEDGQLLADLPRMSVLWVKLEPAE